jgi:mRNA-degrading endonuclease RelE of RelBE toxin-antitoxin system
MGYAIEYTDEALADLDAIDPFDRVRILDDIAEQLTHQPTVVTRRRRFLTPEQGLTEIGAAWELKVEDYRVLYDVVPETNVLVIRVIFKGTMTLAEALAKATQTEESGNKEE